jgi:hypothetical protein
MSYKKSKEAVKRTFVDPFLNLKRNLLYLGTFLGVFGFGVMNTVSSYDLGTAGLMSIMGYFAPSLLLAGFVYWPLLYMGYSSADGIKWRSFVLALQALSIVAFAYTPPHPVYQGLAFGVTMSPFWTAHHIAMVQNTTKGNRGYEVSIGQFIFLTSGVVAAITSAHFLENMRLQTGLLIALGALLGGTLCLMISSNIVRQHTVRHFIKECKSIVTDNPYMARRIVSQSLFDMPSFTLAALMHIMGISPTIMATVIIARLVLMFFLSPLIGTLAHKHRKNGYGLGLSLVSVAWFILCVAPDQSLAFFLCLIFYAIGMNIASSSLMTGLYEKQSYATMLWSEVFLAIGRGSSMLLFIPIMYYNVRLYLMVLSALALAIFIINRKWLKKYAQEALSKGEVGHEKV